eukprot:scaffold87867_cov59-Phaeocystis_antarctica.AAC.2
MASPENLGSLYFSAAAWALEMVGLEMMIGLALSEARLKRTLSASPGLEASAAYVSQLERASRCTRPMRPAPITPACAAHGHRTGTACTPHGIACAPHGIACAPHGIACAPHVHRMCTACASHVHRMCITSRAVSPTLRTPSDRAMPTAPRWAAEVLERHELGSCSAWTTASAIATVHTRMPRGAMARADGACPERADLRNAAATGGKARDNPSVKSQPPVGHVSKLA